MPQGPGIPGTQADVVCDLADLLCHQHECLGSSGVDNAGEDLGRSVERLEAHLGETFLLHVRCESPAVVADGTREAREPAGVRGERKAHGGLPQRREPVENPHAEALDLRPLAVGSIEEWHVPIGRRHRSHHCEETMEVSGNQHERRENHPRERGVFGIVARHVLMAPVPEFRRQVPPTLINERVEIVSDLLVSRLPPFHIRRIGDETPLDRLVVFLRQMPRSTHGRSDLENRELSLLPAGQLSEIIPACIDLTTCVSLDHK